MPATRPLLGVVAGEPYRSDERPAMILRYLRDMPHGEVLSLGCGNGSVELQLARATPQLSYRCIDISAKAIGEAERAKHSKDYSDLKNIRFEVADNMKVKDEGMVAILRLRTAGDWEKLVPCLKPGGVLVYEGIGSYDGNAAPKWADVFKGVLHEDYSGVKRFTENKRQLGGLGLRLLEERLFYACHAYKRESLRPGIKRFLFHRREYRKRLRQRGASFERDFEIVKENWHRTLGTCSPESYPLGYAHIWLVYSKPE
ncbi:MAG: class I SAM-dependent methyltransferase [Candidatus Aenigmatarchaeota archaeon]